MVLLKDQKAIFLLERNLLSIQEKQLTSSGLSEQLHSISWKSDSKNAAPANVSVLIQQKLCFK